MTEKDRIEYSLRHSPWGLNISKRSIGLIVKYFMHFWEHNYQPGILDFLILYSQLSEGIIPYAICELTPKDSPEVKRGIVNLLKYALEWDWEGKKTDDLSK